MLRLPSVLLWAGVNLASFWALRSRSGALPERWLLRLLLTTHQRAPERRREAKAELASCKTLAITAWCAAVFTTLHLHYSYRLGITDVAQRLHAALYRLEPRAVSISALHTAAAAFHRLLRSATMGKANKQKAKKLAKKRAKTLLKSRDDDAMVIDDETPLQRRLTGRQKHAQKVAAKRALRAAKQDIQQQRWAIPKRSVDRKAERKQLVEQAKALRRDGRRCDRGRRRRTRRRRAGRRRAHDRRREAGVRLRRRREEGAKGRETAREGARARSAIRRRRPENTVKMA